MAITNNATFKTNFSAILKQAGDKADLVVRKTALQLQSRMVERSPVLSGRFKGNWQCGIGSVNSSIDAAEDITGLSSIDRTGTAVQDWKTGQTIYLTQSLPYAQRLENGWSQQAPQGMVALTVVEFNQALAQAVAQSA